MSSAYYDTVRLLIDVAPDVFRSECFAMKGGTALNLFVQEMPRLSVDIDLVYQPYRVPRQKALDEIAKELKNIAKRLKRRGMAIQLGAMDAGDEVKLFVRRGESMVKVEVNHVFRGTVLPVSRRPLVSAAINVFTTSLSLPMLAVEELYASKLVAAFDRQHPRDFFDILGLYASGGITHRTLECFVNVHAMCQLRTLRANLQWDHYWSRN